MNLCRKCTKYLPCRGCIYELKYEETGECEGYNEIDNRTPEERKYDAMENEGDRKCHLMGEGEL